MNGGNDTMYYIHKDVQGSFDLITDDGGNVLERLSFDPWGRRRNSTDWTYENVPPPQYFDRGYTGHEHLDIFGLINMNGRVYDPWLGRFLSPDPFVQSPGNSQSYNRYSYCLNNPLKYVDPSGYLVNRHPADWSKSSGGVYMWGYEVSGMYFYDRARNNFDLYCAYVGAQDDIGNMDFQTWQQYGGAAGMSGEQVFNNYVAQNSIQFTGQAALSIIQDVVDGMNIHSISAFGRNTLVSCFGELGPIEKVADGAIYSNNPTSAAYTGECVIFAKMASSVSALNYNDRFAGTVEELEGKPYIFGADGPDAYDCSGTVCYGIRKVGNSKFGDYSAHDLYKKFSIPSNSQNRGTVIFYDYTSDGRIDHVTTILNSSDMLHPSSGAGVLQVKPINYLDSYTNDRGGTIYYQELNWQLIINKIP